MTVRENKVVGCSRTGGEKGWQLYSISRWTSEDGSRLKGYIKTEFESGNRQIYWDDIAMFCHCDKFDLGIYEMKREDVIELDSFEELQKLDKSYKG